MKTLIDLAERRWLPDALVRTGIRRAIAKRLKRETAPDDEEHQARLDAFVAELDASPIAIDPMRDALPPQFFELHLGPRLKYSSCLFATGRENLAGAEEAMLASYADRAQLADHQRVLDLGCGWGSFALWAAARYPRSTIVALSDSPAQSAFVERMAAERRLSNLVAVTGDVADVEFETVTLDRGFDRVVSIGMFEHVRNYRQLLSRIARWLVDDGRVFVQVSCNRQVAYLVDDDGDDWMGRSSVIGGTMPSFDLFKRFDDDLVVDKRWWVSGRHYERTVKEWLRRMEVNQDAILDVFDRTYGEADSRTWFARWRMFYMAMIELFSHDDGRTWGVGHYRFAKRDAAVTTE